MKKNTRWTIHNQDVMKWAEEYEGEKFHALLTDAPYHLITITKRFGKNGSAPAKFGKDGVFQRASKGFMGQDWDGGDISFRPETWAALGKHLYPGAFGMTFGGSRTAHRIAVAIEDAGFIIHPMIVWVYGSGFPKATRVKGHKEFDGHRYGMQALKPAAEPIIVFQKPYDGKPVDNIVKYGSGALNIDAGRIPLADGDGYVINTFDDGAKPFGNGAGHKYTSRKVVKEDKRLGGKGTWKTDKAAKNVYEGGYVGVDVGSSALGRWPANFVIDDYMSNVLDTQAEGTSRYFYNVQTQLDNADPFLYAKKASGKERNAGLEKGPEHKLGHNRFDKCSVCGGYMFQNKSRKSACKCDNPQREDNTQKNPHPTVKPLDLTHYLASLLLPPDGYAPRRILVPFAGVMSEAIGCLLAGWEYVEAIELGKEYCKIGEKRLRHWVK